MMKLTVIAAVLAAAAVSAQTQNIVQIAQADPELRLLVDALTAGGLVSTLEGTGPFTVFAPIDQAFGALGDNIIDYVFNPQNVKALDNVLTYHVVSGAVPSSALKDGQVIPTLDGSETVTAHVNGADIHINGARVIRANIQASNGIIHIVDGVLVPSNFAYPKNDIVATAVATSALSTLVTALKAGNIVKLLTYPAGPYTVLAPSNDAFAKIPSATLAYLLAHPAELDAILAYHVIDARGDRGRGRIYSDEIVNFQEVFTLNGQPVVFVVAGGKVLVNGNSTVVIPDVDTSNGVVHVIDTVLMPNPAAEKALNARAAAWYARQRLGGKAIAALPNIVQLAESVPTLSTLVAAVTAGGLVSTLEGTGPFTVFAPTDAAFSALPDAFLAYLLANPKQLDDVLTYHVVAGNVTSNQLFDGEMVPTVEGKNVTVHKDQRGAVYINFARVTAANNFASNGVVHIIDGVLLP